MDHSRHWFERQDLYSFVEDGFPFDEGLPAGSSRSDEFEIILRTGEHVRAVVEYGDPFDGSSESRWRAIGPSSIADPSIDVVVAWKRVRR